MPFRLKDVGIRYHKLVIIVFTDLIYGKVEAYINDMAVKMSKGKSHPQDVHDVFDRLLK